MVFSTCVITALDEWIIVEIITVEKTTWEINDVFEEVLN